MKTSEETKNIFKALSEFKKDFKQPLKDADNPFFKSKYVPLESIVQAIDNEAPKHGLGYFQEATTNEHSEVGVKTTVIHSSGEYIESDILYVKPDKNTPQGIGSAITYAKRYGLSAMFGVASDVDDDGNEASGNNAKKASKSQLKQMEDLRKEYTTKANLDYDAKKKLDDWVDKTMANPDYLQATENAVNRTITGLKKMLDDLPAEEEKEPEAEVSDIEQIPLMDRAGKPNDK